jgi:hypothetical protein
MLGGLLSDRPLWLVINSNVLGASKRKGWKSIIPTIQTGFIYGTIQMIVLLHCVGSAISGGMTTSVRGIM